MVDTPPKLLRDQCFFCHKVVKAGPAPGCTGCHAVIYCSPEHQSADRPSHEAACSSIQQSQHEGNEELSKLQTKCHQCFNDQDAEPDHFWEWRDIRSYIQARHRLVVLLCRMPTGRALARALHHSLDILRLNPSDNLDVRFLVPSMMIRLGMDKDASEFIRRYRKVSPNCQYAWAHLDMVLPEPKPESNEDSASAEWLDECVPLPFKAAFALLRLRLLFCLHDLEHANLLASRLPPEIVWLVRDNLVTGGVVGDCELWKDVRVGESIRDRIAGLEKQLGEMFEGVKERSPDFWTNLIQCRWPFAAVNSLALEQTRDSWIETPGAVDWVQAKARAAK